MCFNEQSQVGETLSFSPQNPHSTGASLPSSPALLFRKPWCSAVRRAAHVVPQGILAAAPVLDAKSRHTVRGYESRAEKRTGRWTRGACSAFEVCSVSSFLLLFGLPLEKNRSVLGTAGLSTADRLSHAAGSVAAGASAWTRASTLASSVSGSKSVVCCFHLECQLLSNELSNNASKHK